MYATPNLRKWIVLAEIAGFRVTNSSPSLNDLKEGVRIITVSVAGQCNWLDGVVTNDPFHDDTETDPAQRWKVTIETRNGTSTFVVANMGIPTPEAAASTRNISYIVAAY